LLQINQVYYRNTQTKAKLKWKLFAKTIREPSKEAWVQIDSESNKKRSRSALIRSGEDNVS
jgi:hypothetical protein